MEQHILSTIIQFASCAFLLFAVLLWVRRNGSRSRVYFSITYLVCGIDLSSRIFNLYSGVPIIHEALHPVNLYMALIEIPLFLFYLIEVVNPGWLTWQKIGVLFLPWGMWNILLLIPGIHFRELGSFGDILGYIGEANVWLRLLFVFLLLPYTLLIYRIPYNWRQSSADRGVILTYGAGFILVIVLYICSSVSGLVLISSLHLFYGIIFCFCTIYYELFLRLNVPLERTEEKHPGKPKILQPTIITSFADKLTENNTKATEEQGSKPSPDNELWKMLTTLMDDGKLWRNPDFSLPDLANLLGTNRTTLLCLLKENGYAGGYREYINQHRIEDFVEEMKQHPQKNIQEVFFEVGYRSKATAYRNFKEYVGEAPSEYFVNQSEDI